MSVFPVESVKTFVVGVVIVPEPSAAYCVIDGCAARETKVPPDVPFCCVVHSTASVADDAVAPEPAP